VPTTVTNVSQTLTLPFEHRPALMAHEQIVHVNRVLLFLRVPVQGVWSFVRIEHAAHAHVAALTAPVNLLT